MPPTEEEDIATNMALRLFVWICYIVFVVAGITALTVMFRLIFFLFTGK